MKKYVKLFEFFAGIGSQYQALKNLENEMNFKTISLGTCDFFIPSIISYMIIHHGLLKPENELSKTEMIKILKQFSWSKDSKKLVADNYFEKMSESKLKSIFPYLFAYVDNEYFAKKYQFSIDQRERERERTIA
ncbi:DNA (cytosine-5-)-methyltransferase N-terminal subunit [Mycoplasmopsis fermentans]|uniref:DNA (cytosine-5-)-methyltransferase N-terminal subunit n=1 Tax=Mycoplasmopsis fermentans TaxID=2115 RepID=UPI00031A3560|nr:hypothetical protein [Mycoplasmopsis fermentans]